jgi:hypothetical protein
MSKKLRILRTFRLTEEYWAHHSSSVFKAHLFLNNDVIQIMWILFWGSSGHFSKEIWKHSPEIEGCLPKIYNLYSCRQLILDSFRDGHGRCCSRTEKWWIALSSISSLNCRHILFTTEHARTLYFAFMYHEMQTTQPYQLLHPLCTWSFLSKLKMLWWLHSESFFISSILAIS